MQHPLPSVLGQSEAVLVLVAENVVVFHCVEIVTVAAGYIYALEIFHNYLKPSLQPHLKSWGS